MDEQLSELKDRISQMSDQELLRIVEVEYADYRKEAIEFAQTELTKRYVPFEKHEPDEMESDEEESDEPPDPAANVDPCANCGGPMRGGLLFAEKELTILLQDNNEERFVQAFACTRCGEVRLVVDFATEVEG
jgi:hypothetical protein